MTWHLKAWLYTWYASKSKFSTCGGLERTNTFVILTLGMRCDVYCSLDFLTCPARNKSLMEWVFFNEKSYLKNWWTEGGICIRCVLYFVFICVTCFLCYILQTSDVQTAILIILHMKVSEVFKDPRVSSWIEK